VAAVIFTHATPEEAREIGLFVITTQPLFERTVAGYTYQVYGYRDGAELTAPETIEVTIDPRTLPRRTR
jgi:hypothetical protein